MSIKTNSLLICICLITLSMLHWPSFFATTEFATIVIRYSIWTLALLLLIYRINWNFNLFEISIIGLIVFFIFLELTLSINPSRNVYSYYSIIFLFILTYNFLRTNREGRESFIKYWIIFSYFIMLSSILVSIIHNLTPYNFDPLNFYDSFVHSRRWEIDKFSLFGKSSIKEEVFGFFDVYRVSGYLNEPGDLGFFAIINLLIIKF